MEISSIDANPVGRGRGNVRRTAPFVRVGDASSTTVSKQGAQADNTLRVGRGRGNVYSSRSRVSWSGDASRLLTRIGEHPKLKML
jgi:hypothetical protein